MPVRPSDIDLSDGPAKEARLFLIDGNGLMFRAFYALPEDIATSDGMPTNALLGFANMLWKLVSDYRPHGVIVCWDEKPTRRLELDPEYKASRKPMPDLLAEQRPFFRPLVEAFGYRNLSVEGCEADDVIGTLSRLADEAGIRTCIVSTDRDAFQLVSDNVCLMMTPRGVADVNVYTPERVAIRLGVPHTLVPDLIGLKGDPGDDIKGVPGIGDKTAADLLSRYGSFDGVFEHLDELTPARRTNLATHEEQARKSRTLGTIDRHIADLADFDTGTVVNDPPDRSRLAEMLRQFEFRGLLGRLDELDRVDAAHPSPPVAPVAPADDTPIREVTLDELEDVVGGRPVGLAADDQRAAVSIDDEVLLVHSTPAAVATALADAGVVAHDIKSMPHVLLQAGLVPAFDTYLAAYLIEPGRAGYALDELLRDQGLAVSTPHADDEVSALASRALAARLLYDPLAERLTERRGMRLLTDVEQPLVVVLAAMEDVGVRVRPDVLAELAGRVAAEAAEVERECYALAGSEFQIGSTKQLAAVLFDTLGLPTDRKGKTGYSTDRSVLAKLRPLHPIIDLVERWRELTKLLSTYLAETALPAAIAADGRIHTTFSQVTAATGRLASQGPNLQNIPVRTALGREIRRAFVPADGMRLLSADYSQVELRILAHLCREPALVEAFTRGDDVHRATAAEVLGKPANELTKDERDRAKAVNFGIIYGISAFGLSEQLTIPRDEAQAYIDLYLGRYPRVREFIADTIAVAEKTGYAETLLGRRRPVPELRARNRQLRSLGERLAVNSAIQGSAADIIKVAMVSCHRRLRDEGLRARLVLQIHDELLFEVPDEETSTVTRLVTEEMTRAYPLDPALAIDVGSGEDWLAAKS